MSKQADVSAVLAALITSKSKGAPTSVSASLPDQDDPVAVLVQSFLLWGADTERAAAAYEKIRKHCFDFNELRVSMADEVASVIGTRYPNVEERCRRMRSVLRALWLREHAMTFAAGAAAGKRQLRRYVESLHGMVPYVAERTLLVGFGVHAMPVDEPLRLRLAEEGVLAEDTTDADASALLLKHVKASDALGAHLALQAWIDEVGAPARKPAPKKAPAKSASKKTTSKKSTTKASAEPSATKKPATKKSASKKTASKPAAKKSASKKTTTRKTTSKAATSKKTSSRKVASRSK